MSEKKSLFGALNPATRSDRVSLRKEARIKKTMQKLNSPKRIKKDFDFVPNIEAEYSLKKLIKENTLHFHLFQKQLFANENKNLQVKKHKLVPTSIFKTKNTAKRIVSSVLATAALLTGSYGTKLFVNHVVPLVEQAYYDYKTNKLPTHKEIGSYDFSSNKPQNIIENKDFEKNESTEKIAEEKSLLPQIKFDESAINSYKNLLENINETVEIFTGNKAACTPVFGFVFENDLREKTINIVCKDENKNSILLQYDVYDDVLFYSLFGSNVISASDAINNLNLLLDNGNLYDLPQVCPSFEYENSIFSHTSEVLKYVQKDIVYEEGSETGTYKETEYFKFDIIKILKDGKIVEQQVKISKENAEKLGITEENKDSLYGEFNENKEAFESQEIELESNFNIETTLFLNAIKSKNEKTQNNTSQKEFE